VLNRSTTMILHRFFEVGILFKGIDGGLELVGGLLLLLLSPAAINGIVFFFISGELREDPTDLVANLILHSTRTVIQSRTLASAFLLLHGVTKLLLVAALVSNRLWSYPAAIVMFTGFTTYQIYQLSHQPSLFLEIVTLLDIIVVLLIIAEYRHVKLARRREL